MPHDKNGKLLSVGDIINIPCKIKEIQLTEDYCNLTVETTERMPPDNRYTNTYNLNAKQVIKAE